MKVIHPGYMDIHAHVWPRGIALGACIPGGLKMEGQKIDQDGQPEDRSGKPGPPTYLGTWV